MNQTRPGPRELPYGLPGLRCLEAVVVLCGGDLETDPVHFTLYKQGLGWARESALLSGFEQRLA